MAAAQSLRTRALSTILLTFVGLTVVIAVIGLLVVKTGLENDLRARGNVIGRALAQSADVSVMARQGNGHAVERGLLWLVNAVGEELVSVIVETPDGKPLAGVGPEGALKEDDLAAAALRKPRGSAIEIVVETTLASSDAEKAAAAEDPLEAAMKAEAPKADKPAGDPKVRIMLSGKGQVRRQTAGIVITGVALCLISLLLLWRIAGDAFRRIEPAFDQARKMAQGDFLEQIHDEEYRELAVLFDALNDISQSLSLMIGDVRSLGDEIASAVERITGASGSLRTGADQGTRAVAVTEGAVTAMQKTVDESARRLTDLATTADASSRDTETIERANASTGEIVRALTGELERHARSLVVIDDRTKALSRDARAVGDAAEAARAAAKRMQATSHEGTQRASEAAKLAEHAMHDSQAGGKAIEDAIDRFQEIASLGATMEGSLQGLTTRVEGMNPVLGAIADVTSRTSLLALNAGIIAAQAGERGAAFQVVVDELKSLAARTAQLTSTVEQSVRTVLEQRGRTNDAAEALQRVVAASIEDAHRAGAALDAIRSSTTQSQQVSAQIELALQTQERDVQETLERIDVVDDAGRSVEATARALAEEVRVLKDVADRVTTVSSEVARASAEQGALAARVGQVLGLVSRQVRELSSTQGEQRTDVARVEKSLAEIRRFSDDARNGAAQLDAVVQRVRQGTAGLNEALGRFRMRA
jgi:methyl-accepting chemotaxis protein